MSLAKAREFLEVAELCLERGYCNSTANRADYAMFHAAATALEIAGLGRETWSIDVYPPFDWTFDQLDELEEKIGEKKLDILVERGHYVHTFVYEPEQQIEEALRQKAEAERVLAEAGIDYQTGDQ